MPTPPDSNDLRDTATAVIARTAAAWNIAPESSRAAARRAPRGYVPVRIRRRLRAASASAPCPRELRSLLSWPAGPKPAA
ncbi:hypothetical protein [Variovorax sp. OV329]|uniref:hypothetical protein n=1 Tax=Variovorax sp. OV329 TaxID=1882825 RepID=UPI0008E83E0E|nr:hypothetical protein [Variovorax sp. OV329]SFN21448.1 hypothetical protein SAMN05444747_11835 [Variovorax sp. OV329]